MNRDPDDPGRSARPPRKIVWIIGAVLIVFALAIVAQGIVRGTGEAVGVTKAAPGDDNATPAPESAQGG